MNSILALLFTAAVLSGCSSLKIENRDLPKCSGSDRRPLNKDLWDWENNMTEKTGTLRSQFVPEPARPQPLSTQAFKQSVSDLPMKVSTPQGRNIRWDVAASELNCGENNG